MVYVIYKTTNTTTGRFYIGKWSAEDVDSRIYLGSGRALRADIKAFGRASFRREILFVFDTPEAAIEMERSIVTNEFCERDDTYNIAIGGQGTFVHLRGRPGWVGTAEQRAQQRAMVISTNSQRSRTLRQRWATDPEAKERHRRGIAKARRARGGQWGPLTHSAETRAARSKALKAHYADHQHQASGTRWMTRDGKVTRVPHVDVDHHLSDGWIFGRRP
jgi:hypothetical protein